LKQLHYQLQLVIGVDQESELLVIVVDLITENRKNNLFIKIKKNHILIKLLQCQVIEKSRILEI
jgi:hypothetical protein